MRYKSCLLALIVAFAACVDNGTDIVIDDPPEFPVLATWQASVTGLPARPQATGTVSAQEYGSFLHATANVNGLLPASTYQWKLYFGTCSQRVASFGPNNANPPAYPPITANASGGGSAVATVAGRFKADSTYHVRFYVPLTGPVDTTWAACGDLTRS